MAGSKIDAAEATGAGPGCKTPTEMAQAEVLRRKQVMEAAALFLAPLLAAVRAVKADYPECFLRVDPPTAYGASKVQGILHVPAFHSVPTATGRMPARREIVDYALDLDIHAPRLVVETFDRDEEERTCAVWTNAYVSEGNLAAPGVRALAETVLTAAADMRLDAEEEGIPALSI